RHGQRDDEHRAGGEPGLERQPARPGDIPLAATPRERPAGRLHQPAPRVGQAEASGQGSDSLPDASAALPADFVMTHPQTRWKAWSSPRASLGRGRGRKPGTPLFQGFLVGSRRTVPAGSPATVHSECAASPAIRAGAVTETTVDAEGYLRVHSTQCTLHS